jgi:predicted AAA+ superfamily ATPase
VKSPKLYFYDVGLASYLLGIEKISHMETHPLRGNIFENLVLMEILKYRYNQGKRNNLNFYRDSNGNEVDIIYSLGQHVLPIEIKAGETVAPDFFKGIRAFDKVSSDLPYGKVVIYGGNREETRGDIKIAKVTDIYGILDQIS